MPSSPSVGEELARAAVRNEAGDIVGWARVVRDGDFARMVMPDMSALPAGTYTVDEAVIPFGAATGTSRA